MITETFLSQLLSVMTGIAVLLGNIGGYVANLTQSQPVTRLGSINFVAGNKFYLSGSGLGASDTSIGLDSFTTPNGVELTMTDFGSIGYATIEPGSSKKEFVSFTGVTQTAGNTKATLTGVSRGLLFVSPYTASSSLAQTHSGGTILIISNPPQLYNELATKSNTETITGTWTFASTSIPRLDTTATTSLTNGAMFITKNYADGLTYAGAPNVSTTTKGIGELSTREELASSTILGATGAYLMPHNQLFSSTTVSTTTIPYTGATGKLSQGFLDLTADWTFSGTTTLSTTTLNFSPATSTDATNKTYVDALTYRWASSSASLKLSANTERTGVQTVATKKKEIVIAEFGNANVAFDLSDTTNGDGHTSYAQVWLNGSSTVAERSNATGSYLTFTEYLSGLKVGDLIQLYARTSNVADAYKVRNFRIYYDLTTSTSSVDYVITD